VICTETYLRRFEGGDKSGQGLGVRWEGAIVTQELYEAEASNSKFIPVCFLPKTPSTFRDPCSASHVICSVGSWRPNQSLSMPWCPHAALNRAGQDSVDLVDIDIHGYHRISM
jgi:hypothetical protein